ncbi:RICIN domain-containing protein [Kitasatospora purpeofusca]|uniref:RICIN domain-containing protein n=1 Tax=Kitasatospora purpeofusca TaxID=67352 RepID=UPI0035DA6C9C
MGHRSTELRRRRRRRTGKRTALISLAVAAGLVAGALGISTAMESSAVHDTAATSAVAGSVDGVGGAMAGTIADDGTGQTGTAENATRAPGPKRDQKAAPIKEIPKDQPDRGLVYAGLNLPAGDRCAGSLEVTGGELCSHGPDAPPKDVDIRKDVPPVAAAVAQPAPLTPPADAQPPSAADLVKGTMPVLDAATKTLLADAAGDQAVAAAPAAGGQGVVCEGDGSAGNRVQVVYAHTPGNDRFAQYLASFKKWAADVDVIYNASAQETGGVRHVRFVTESDCSASVLNIQVSDAEMADFNTSNRAIAAQGLNRKDRKYMIFADAKVYCGIGTFAGDERPGQDNLSNFGPSYGRTDSGCWGGHTAAHELGHNLGAVSNSAPNSSKGGHCVDEWDIMCYSDAPYYPAMRTVCPDNASDMRLDCRHDDYYHTDPAPGSYLATHWNVANNRFLIAGGGTGPTPDPTRTPTGSPTPTNSPTRSPSPTATGGTPTPTGTPTATGSPTASPTATNSASPTASPTGTPTPTGSPTGTGTPTPTGTPTATGTPSPTGSTTPTPSPTASPTGGTTGPVMTVSQVTQTSAVLSWPAVNGASGYDVLLNGQTIGTVRATVVGVVRLAPDTSYSVAVAVRDAAGAVSKPGRAAAFRTSADAGKPQPGTRYSLLNGLTGQAADLWGSSLNDGTVAIAYQRTGYANQKWTFEDTGSGTLRIKSVRSEKCLQLGGNPVAGQYVAQRPCSDAAGQKWRVTSAGGAVVLTADGSELVLGASKRWYYGGWLLELQKPNGQTYQSWNLQKTT